MKHISRNKIISVSASSEDPNFPVERVLDNHPKRKYKALPGISAAIITAIIAGGCSDIMIAGTNAATASVIVSDPSATVWETAYFTNSSSTNLMSGFLSGATNVYETFTTSGVNITSAINSSGTGQAYSPTSSLQIGTQYELIINVTINSGYGPFILTGSLPTIPTGVIPSTFLGAGEHRILFTASSSMGYIWLRNTNAANYSATFVLRKYVPVVEFKNKEIEVGGSVIQRSLSQSLWITLDSVVDVSAKADIYLYGPDGQALEVGVCSAGNAMSYNDPKYGLALDPIDYSIQDENSNGSFYYKKRDIVRSFSLDALLQTDDAYIFLNNFISSGSTPSAWKLTDLDGNEWVVYGRITQVASNYNYPNHVLLSFTVTEVL